MFPPVQRSGQIEQSCRSAGKTISVPAADHVTVEAVVRVLLANAEHARRLVTTVVPQIGQARSLCPCGCDRALDNAIITAPGQRAPALMAKLDAVAGRVLNG